MSTRIAVKNLRSYLENIRNKVEDRTGITNWGEGSIARAFSESISSELLNNKKLLVESFNTREVATAQAEHLDIVANNYGLERNPANFASATTHEKTLVFYTDTTFGDINDGNNITIPVGTEIKNEAENIVYIVQQELTLLSAATIGYAAIKAVDAGSGWNVSSHVLTKHNFTGYTNAADGSLKVINLNPILNGTDLESDEKLRFRVANRDASLVRANSAALTLDGLTVPGIQDIRVIEGYYGPGSVAVAVFGAEGESNSGLANALNQKLKVNRVYGSKVTAIPGVRVYIDFEIEIGLRQRIGDTNLKRIENGIKDAIRKYFLSILSTRRLDLRSLRKYIIENVPEIQKISGKNEREFFKNVFIRREYATSLRTSMRETLQGFIYEAEPEEFFYPSNLEISFVLL